MRLGLLCCQLRKFSQANLDPVSRFRGLIVNNDNDVLEFFTACKSHHLGLNSESKHTFLADSLIVLSEKAKAIRSLSKVQHQLRRGAFLRWWSAEFVEVLKANNVVNLPSIILALSKLHITCKDLPDRWVDIYLTSIIRQTPRWSPEQLSATVSSLSRVCLRQSTILDQWMIVFLEKTQSELSTFDDKCLFDTVIGVSHLIQLSTISFSTWLIAFCNASRKRLVRYSLRELDSMVHAMNKMGLSESNKEYVEWLREYFIITEPKLSEFDAISLVRILYNIAKMPAHPDDYSLTWLSSYLASTKRHLDSNRLDTQRHSNLLLALSRLRINPDEIEAGWISSFLRSSLPILHSFSSQGLSNTIYAFKVIGIDPVEVNSRWMAVFLKTIQAQVQTFDVQGIANCMYALSFMPSCLPDGNSELNNIWIKAFLSSSKSKLPLFNSQNYSNIIYALSKLVHVPSKVLTGFKLKNEAFPSLQLPAKVSRYDVCSNRDDMDLLQSWIVEFVKCSEMKLSTFNEQALNNTIVSFWKLRINPGHINEKWMSKFLTLSSKTLSRFTPQELCTMVNSLGQLGVRPDSNWSVKFLSTSLAMMPRFNEQNFSNCVYGIYKIGIMYPKGRAVSVRNQQQEEEAVENKVKVDVLSDEWVKQFLTLSEPRLPSFTSQGLSNTIYALANLGVNPADFSEKWLPTFFSSALSKIHSFNSQGVCMVLTSLSLLDLDMIPLEYFIAPMQELALSQQMFSEDQVQLLYFHCFYSLKTSKRFLPDALRAEFINARRDATESNLVSSAEVEVLEFLQATELGFQPSHYVGEIGSVVDFFSPALNLVLQFDGPSHFLPDGSADMSTRLQTRLLESLGYRVRRLSYKQWIVVRRKTREEIIEFLLQFLKH